MGYHLPPSQMQILPCPASSQFTLILMAARFLFCVLTWQQKITWCYAQDLRTTWRHSLTDSSSSSLELQLLGEGSGRGNQNNKRRKIVTKIETRRGLAGFTHFLVSPRKGHHCWAINICPEIKRLSVWKGENHRKKPSHTQSRGFHDSYCLFQMQGIFLQPRLLLQACCYVPEKEKLHCLHRSPVMSHRC